MQLIKIENVSKKYHKMKTYALEDVSFDIKTGEAFGILGPNGAGKTTLMGIITTLVLPSSGNVYIDGEKITRSRTDIKGKIALVTQHISIRRDMSVYEVMLLAGMLYGISLKEIKSRTNKILEFTGLLEKKKDTARGLSGGMQRKLMISRAMLTKPEIMVLDEPTVGLDPHSRRKIWDLLSQLKQKGITILLTTHYIEEAESVCDRVAFINKGKASEINTPLKMISELGRYTVDVFESGKTVSRFFSRKEQAINFGKKYGEAARIRETNLEDVFIEKMGAELGENK